METINDGDRRRTVATIPEYARLRGVTTKTVKRWVKQNRITTLRKHDRTMVNVEASAEFEEPTLTGNHAPMDKRAQRNQVVLEKQQKALDEVSYEMRMLRSSADLLSAEPDCNVVIYRLRLEAFMIYASSLIDFLYNDTRGNSKDIRAMDFFPSVKAWQAVRPDQPHLLETVPRLARKHLERITCAGLNTRLDWPFKSIADSIERVFSVFWTNL